MTTPIQQAEEAVAIHWRAIAEDDFCAEYDDLTLRVEQMDDDVWWWAVYRGNEEVAFDNPKATTEATAKTLAESVIYRAAAVRREVVIQRVRQAREEMEKRFEGLSQIVGEGVGSVVSTAAKETARTFLSLLDQALQEKP